MEQPDGNVIVSIHSRPIKPGETCIFSTLSYLIKVSIHSRPIKPGEFRRLGVWPGYICFNPLPTNKAGRMPRCKGVKYKRFLTCLREPIRRECDGWFAARVHGFVPSKINGLRLRETPRKFAIATGSRSTLSLIIIS